MKIALSTLKQLFAVALLAVAFATTSFAQTIPSSQVPQAVLDAGNKQCSGDVAWSHGPKGLYEARFEKSGTDYVYVFAKSGQLSVKKKAINSILIPNSINTDLASNHSGYRLNEVFQVLNRSKEKYYEVHASNESTQKRLRYSLAGAYVSALDIKTSEADQTLVASSESVPVTTSGTVDSSEGMMRGESEDFDDMELIDDDIADLFGDDEEDDDLFEDDLTEDEGWDDIMLEEDDDDDFGDLEDWDVPEGDGF